MNTIHTYSFGIPGPVIWITHLLVAALLIYIGYNLINKRPIPSNIGIILVVLGSLAALYHLHLWYLNRFN